MMADESDPTARVEVRISPEGLEAVERAAELECRSVGDLVGIAAQDAARRTTGETHLTRLAVEDQRRFADLLLDPPEPSPALKRARDAHKRLVRPSR